VDWRDAPVTPGEWRLVPTADGSGVDFANRFAMRCMRPSDTIIITIRGPFTGPSGTIRVTTDAREQLLAARPSADGLAAALPARDPLLDAMAFSRGRFRVVTSDGRSLVMPSWTEISRVIEDCR
jgi:hypothetical protein